MVDDPLGWDPFFQDDGQRINSTIVLFATALALAGDAHVIVDVGCGRGAAVETPSVGRRLHDLRGPDRHVVGIDIDPAGKQNPVLDEFRLIEDDRWPLDDASVDLVYSDWTLEHIENPDRFVAELTRVLRPGGALVARTVSRYSPLSIGARTIPNRLHSTVLSRLQPSRQERDIFPTVYRMNTLRDLRRLLDPGYEWAVTFHPGLHSYFGPWPRLARIITAVEPRLPLQAQLALVITARKLAPGASVPPPAVVATDNRKLLPEH